jgi:PTH1 family peptidyl-tRNA hydrolase
MKLLVGLGNPGAKYARNRHNIGFMAVERIAERHSFTPWRKRFQGLASDGEIGGEKVLLLKPETFMNDSGRAVGEAVRYAKLGIGDAIVFHDELDLDPGRLKVKVGGGNAGHNGLRSISALVGNDCTRVRLGIGHPGHKDLVAHYVLHDFAKADSEWLEPLLDAIAEAIAPLVAGRPDAFMSEVARRIGGEADAPPKPDKPREAGRSDAPAVKDRHPSGERQNKRQTALAENLKKFLAKRGDGTE